MLVRIGKRSDKHKFTQARQDSNLCAGIIWLCMCLSGPDVCACTCRLSTWAWECVLVVWCTGVCMHACVCACECCVRAWLRVYVWVLRACVGACVCVSVAWMQFVCMRACVYNHHTSSCVLNRRLSIPIQGHLIRCARGHDFEPPSKYFFVVCFHSY